jgi:hypothetical protein
MLRANSAKRESLVTWPRLPPFPRFRWQFPSRLRAISVTSQNRERGKSRANRKHIGISSPRYSEPTPSAPSCPVSRVSLFAPGSSPTTRRGHDRTAGSQHRQRVVQEGPAVSVLGTTISPYLFFWQASQEVDGMRRERFRPRLPLKILTRGGRGEWVKSRTPPWLGRARPVAALLAGCCADCGRQTAEAASPLPRAQA